MPDNTSTEIVIDLEIAAQHAENVGRRGATAAQIRYLASLLSSQGHDVESVGLGGSNAVLTVAQASALIDDYKGREET